MPAGTMPAAMQTISTFVPASQMAALFRDSLAQDALDEAFAGVPASEIGSFRCDMGFDLYIGDMMLSEPMMLVYVFGVTAKCNLDELIDDAIANIETIYLNCFEKYSVFNTKFDI